VRDALATYKEKQLYEIAMNVIDSLEKSFAEAEVHELRATVLSAWVRRSSDKLKANRPTGKST